jgi:hypothetical protein
MKKFVVALLISGLLLSGIFVFGGDDKGTGQTTGVKPEMPVNVVEEVK